MATDYTELITSEHADKPKFKALVQLVAGAFGGTTDLTLSLPDAFSLDTAIGEQLDAVGKWVGITRNLQSPLLIYFSFDIAGLGFDQGVWFSPFDPVSGVVVLDDETYRLVIRATIAADHWDGTLTSYQTIMNQALAGTGNSIYAVDNQDMTMTIHVSGPPLSEVVKGILNSGQLAIKPAGVSIASYIIP